MEGSSFLSLLRKYIFIIVALVLATVVGTFFLVKNLPNEYISRTQIATGIVDASRRLLDNNTGPNAQSDQITREFSNLTEIIKLKKIIDQVSYQLIIHDLTSPTPFRLLNHQFKDLSAGAKTHAVAIYRQKLLAGEPLSLYNADEAGLNELLISMHYDERSLRTDFDISRDEESDFITVSFTSDNPQLSAFAVNTICSEFLDYYSVNIKQNESNAVKFLANLLAEKRAAYDGKKDSLQRYKIKNGIINLDEQSKAILGQIYAYTEKKVDAEKLIASYQGAIKNIDARFDPKDRKYIESILTSNNQDVTSLQQQLYSITDQYVRSGFNPKYKTIKDSLQQELTEQLNKNSDKYITNPLVNKDNVVAKKLDLEVQYDLAKYSVQSINDQITELQGKLNHLVPFDAIVKTYEFDIDIASKEYLDVLNKYNATNLQSNFSIKLKQVEPATPSVAEPSKKIILIAVAGVAMFVICLMVLFVMFYMDDTVKQPTDLVSRTKLPLLGSLNVVQGPMPDLRKLWDVENRVKMKQFKELLRSVRFEIDQELQGDKILAITSLAQHEGKTIVTASLAYAYAAINKKVLLIDGNFNNPSVSKTIQPQMYVEDYFANPSYIDNGDSAISVLGNRGTDVTLLEINDEPNIRNAFNELRKKYDIILLDLPPLDSLNKSKEWILFANKTIAVYEANKSITKVQNQYIDYLKSLNGRFSGWVLNKAAVNTGSKKKR